MSFALCQGNRAKKVFAKSFLSLQKNRCSEVAAYCASRLDMRSNICADFCRFGFRLSDHMLHQLTGQVFLFKKRHLHRVCLHTITLAGPENLLSVLCVNKECPNSFPKKVRKNSFFVI